MLATYRFKISLKVKKQVLVISEKTPWGFRKDTVLSAFILAIDFLLRNPHNNQCPQWILFFQKACNFCYKQRSMHKLISSFSFFYTLCSFLIVSLEERSILH